MGYVISSKVEIFCFFLYALNMEASYWQTIYFVGTILIRWKYMQLINCKVHMLARKKTFTIWEEWFVIYYCENILFMKFCNCPGMIFFLVFFRGILYLPCNFKPSMIQIHDLSYHIHIWYVSGTATVSAKVHNHLCNDAIAHNKKVHDHLYIVLWVQILSQRISNKHKYITYI